MCVWGGFGFFFFFWGGSSFFLVSFYFFFVLLFVFVFCFLLGFFYGDRGFVMAFEDFWV